VSASLGTLGHPTHLSDQVSQMGSARTSPGQALQWIEDGWGVYLAFRNPTLTEGDERAQWHDDCVAAYVALCGEDPKPGYLIPPRWSAPPPPGMAFVTGDELSRVLDDFASYVDMASRDWSAHYFAVGWRAGMESKWRGFCRAREREAGALYALNPGKPVPDEARGLVAQMYETRAHFASIRALSMSSTPEDTRGLRQYSDMLHLRSYKLQHGGQVFQNEIPWAWIWHLRKLSSKDLAASGWVVPPRKDVVISNWRQMWISDAPAGFEMREFKSKVDLRGVTALEAAALLCPMRMTRNTRLEGRTSLTVGGRPAALKPYLRRLFEVAQVPEHSWLVHYLPGEYAGRTDGDFEVNWMVVDDMAASKRYTGRLRDLAKILKLYGSRLRLPKCRMPHPGEIQRERVNGAAFPGISSQRISPVKLGCLEASIAIAEKTIAYIKQSSGVRPDCTVHRIGGRDKLVDPPVNTAARGRLVCMGEQAQHLICSLYAQPLGDAITRDPHRTIGIGEGTTGRAMWDWTDRHVDRYALYLDWSAYGPRLVPELQLAGLACCMACYADSAAQQHRSSELLKTYAWMFSCVAEKRLMMKGGIPVRFIGGNPDGNPWTSLVDGIANWLILADVNHTYLGERLAREVEIHVCGDDSEQLYPDPQRGWRSPDVREYVRRASQRWAVRGKPNQSAFSLCTWSAEIGHPTSVRHPGRAKKGLGSKFLGTIDVNGLPTRPVRDWLRVLALPKKKYWRKDDLKAGYINAVAQSAPVLPGGRIEDLLLHYFDDPRERNLPLVVRYGIDIEFVRAVTGLKIRTPYATEKKSKVQDVDHVVLHTWRQFLAQFSVGEWRVEERRRAALLTAQQAAAVEILLNLNGGFTMDWTSSRVPPLPGPAPPRHPNPLGLLSVSKRL